MLQISVTLPANESSNPLWIRASGESWVDGQLAASVVIYYKVSPELVRLLVCFS